MIRITIFLALLLFSSGVQAQIVGNIRVYTLDDAEFEGYVARNPKAGRSRGTVVIVHDWNGLDDYEIRRADMLAAMGYTAFALDVYGAGRRPRNDSESWQFMNELLGDRDTFRARLLGGLAEARRVAGEVRLVLVGYCFGGAGVLELARAGAKVDGFVSVHGALSTPDGQDYRMTTAPILILQGSADPVSGPAEVARLAHELDAAGIEHEAQIYGQARHAYSIWASDDYDLNADRKSWAALVRFLDKRL